MFIVEEDPEGGYWARAVGESIFTEADDLDELRKQVLDAVKCHFEDGEVPKVIRLHFVRDEIIAVSGCRETFPATTLRGNSARLATTSPARPDHTCG